MNSNDRFTAILQRIQKTHDKKGADYGTDEDGLANIRQASDFGMEPWVGAILRANDKMMRLKTFIKRGNLVNESVEDSLLDLAVYTIIALTLYEPGGEIIEDSFAPCSRCKHSLANHGSTNRMGLNMCFICPTTIPLRNRCKL